MQKVTCLEVMARFPEAYAALLADDVDPASDPEYYSFYTMQDGRLLLCTYEISFLGWGTWCPEEKEWNDLENVAYELWEKLTDADSIPITE